jgi:hypothetical protein
MTPQEQHLIEDLFTRLRSVSTSGKDDDAAEFIQTLIARFPDAPYYLTQNVLVQQQALERADARIRELEDLSQRNNAPAPRAPTSFLGGASVPPAGRRAVEPDPQERPRESPWSQQPQSQSGSFLSSALSTATGVAGGMFLAESIRSLFGGGGSGNAVAGEKQQAALDRAQDQAQDAEDDAAQARKDLAADDAALDDMQDQQDDDYDWSDDDDGSLDI